MTDQIRGPGSPAEPGRRGPADPAGQPGRGSGEMLAMVLTTDRETRLERRPVPTPRDDQVLVDIDLCGICGSDLRRPGSPRGLPRRIHHGARAGRPDRRRRARRQRLARRPAGRHQPERRHVRRLRGVPLRAPEPLHPGNDGAGRRPAGRRRAGGTRGGLTKNSARLAGRDGSCRVWLGGASRRRAARRAGRRGTQRAVGARRRWRSDRAAVLPARATLRGGARLAERAVRRTPQLRRSLTGRPRVRSDGRGG